MSHPVLTVPQFAEMVALASHGSDALRIEGVHEFDPRFPAEGPTGVIVTVARSNIAPLLSLFALMGEAGLADPICDLFDAIPMGVHFHAGTLAVVVPCSLFERTDLSAIADFAVSA